MNPADCVVLVPMLRRAHRVQPLLESLRATGDFPVLFCCTPDDHAVLAAVKDAGATHITVPKRRYGDYARKINAGYHHTTEPLLFLAADDLLFHLGWFEAAAARLNDRIAVVGTNDLTNPRTMSGEHSTHTLVSRAYVDEFGTIDAPGLVLHEGYPHEFVDDELVGTAKHRGVWAHAADSIVEHLHPMGGKAPMDALYRQQRERMRAGRRIYDRRRRLWT